MAALGLVAADMTPVTTGQTAFNSGFSAHIAAKNAAMGAKQTKDESRQGLTSAFLNNGLPTGGGTVNVDIVCDGETDPPTTMSIGGKARIYRAARQRPATAVRAQLCRVNPP